MNEKELVNDLINGKSAEVRRQAAEELIFNNTYTNEIVKAFSYALKDLDRGVKDICSRGLINTPNELKKFAAKSVAQYVESSNIELRNLAGNILMNLESHSVNPLLEYLHHPDFYVRQFVIDILGIVADETIADRLIVMLDDEDENVVNATIDALGNLKAHQSIEHIKRIYESNEDLRPVIIEAYRKFGGPEIEQILINIMSSDDDIFIKIACIDALAFVGNNTDLCDRLLEQLMDIPEEVQGILLKAIIAIGFRNEYTIILNDARRHIALNALLDDDEDVRTAGLLALGNEYFEGDVSYLVNEILKYNPDTQELIFNNILAYSKPDILEKFLREYSSICHYDEQHTEFFTLLYNILSNTSTENKDTLYRILFELIVTEHSGFSSEVIETLHIADQESTKYWILEYLKSSEISTQKEVLDLIYNYHFEELYYVFEDCDSGNIEIDGYKAKFLEMISEDNQAVSDTNENDND